MQPTSTLQTYFNGLIVPYMVMIGQALRATREQVNIQLASWTTVANALQTAQSQQADSITALQSQILNLQTADYVPTQTTVSNSDTTWTPNFTTSRLMEATVQSAALLVKRPTLDGQTITAGSFTIEATFTVDCTLTLDTDVSQIVTGQPATVLAGTYLILLDAFINTTYIRLQQKH